MHMENESEGINHMSFLSTGSRVHGPAVLEPKVTGVNCMEWRGPSPAIIPTVVSSNSKLPVYIVEH